MPDVLLNFSSSWPSIQVAKVLNNPTYNTRYEHGLGYPPLAIAMYDVGRVMEQCTVDDTYVYVTESLATATNPYCVVIHPINISSPISYPVQQSAYGEALLDVSSNLDLSSVLLSSRAVSPMLLNITVDGGDIQKTVSYSSPLGFTSFVFGYVSLENGYSWSGFTVGNNAWLASPLSGQSYPVTTTDGTNTSIITSPPNFKYASIVVLRNPAVITNNSVSVNV